MTIKVKKFHQQMFWLIVEKCPVQTRTTSRVQLKQRQTNVFKIRILTAPNPDSALIRSIPRNQLQTALDLELIRSMKITFKAT
jgi:hypothetical protein